MFINALVAVFTSVYFVSFLGFLLVLAGAVYYYLTRNFGKWEKQYGIKGLKPVPLFGTDVDLFLGRISISDLVIKRYKEFEGHRFESYRYKYLMKKPLLKIDERDT